MSNDLGFRLTLGVLLAAVLAVRIVYQVNAVRNLPKATFMESKFNMAARALAGFSGIFMLVVWLAAPQKMRWSSLPLPDWLRWTGTAVGVISVVGLLWIHRALGQNFSGNLHVQTDHQLVTAGPYRWVRHPMYVVFYGLALAFFLLTANWFIGLSWFVVLTLVMLSRVRREETVMLERFGDRYREYAARTGRFLPRLRDRRVAET